LRLLTFLRRTATMGLIDALGGNSAGIDASEAEADQRQKYPLLLHKDECVEMAFQVKGFGRDKSFMTTHRILIKDGKGIGNKRRSYVSIPYNSIQCFSVETAGMLDGDIELKVWTDGNPLSQKIEFSKREVNIWTIQQYMNAKINFSKELATAETAQNRPIPASQWSTPSSSSSSSKKVSLFDWLGGNAYMMDLKMAEDQLKTITPVLLEDETVHMAFRERRDSIFFTSHRLLEVDVQGISGKRIEFISLPWRFIRGFSIETAGPLDVDAVMKLYTNIRGLGCLSQDFRQSRVDLMAIKRYISDRILGVDETPIQAGVDRKEGHVDPKGSWFFRDNQRPLDSVEMDKYYHDLVPILQPGEYVEYAFKGRRDVTLFTTKRFIDIDPKGLAGTRIEYTSVPWSSVMAFGAKTQGKYMDSDAECIIWTDMMFFPGSGEDNPPTPGMASFEIDFNPKLVDVVKMKQYIAKRVLDAGSKIPLDPNTFALAPTGEGQDNWIDWLGNNQRSIDPRAVEEKIRTENSSLLLEDERIIMAFKAGRDTVIFTDMRVMELDVRGMSGQKVKYTSIPYPSIRAFKVESAGDFDRDAYCKVYTRNLWDLKDLSMDFRKGKADVIAIQRFLSAIVLGTPKDATRYLSQVQPLPQKADPASMKSFMSWLLDNSSEEDAETTNGIFHSDPPILLTNEKVNKAFRQGRDLFVYTTHRILIVDVQGIRGKRVEYKSVPMRWCRTFKIETAGHMDRDAETYIGADIDNGMVVEQSILVKKHDIYEMHAYLTNEIIFAKEPPSLAEEPEALIY